MGGEEEETALLELLLDPLEPHPSFTEEGVRRESLFITLSSFSSLDAAAPSPTVVTGTDDDEDEYLEKGINALLPSFILLQV